MAPFIPAIFYALFTIFVFIKIQDWMASYVESSVPQIPLPNGNVGDSPESTESVPCIVVIDGKQENQDIVEKYDEPLARSREFSQNIILTRQEKLKSSAFSLQKINDVIISAFTDFISTIKGQIGDTSEISIGIHDLLLKYHDNVISQ